MSFFVCEFLEPILGHEVELWEYDDLDPAADKTTLLCILVMVELDIEDGFYETFHDKLRKLHPDAPICWITGNESEDYAFTTHPNSRRFDVENFALSGEAGTQLKSFLKL